MRRWRKSTKPPMPKTMEEYTNFLLMPQWINYIQKNKGRLTVITVPGSDGSFAISMTDVNFLESLTVSTLFMDATFKVAPRKLDITQLFSILALFDDTVIPIYWILIQRKSAAAYIAALNHFATIMAPHLRPTLIITDFEKALAQALSSVFPGATHVRCFFHFSQAPMKRAKKIHLLNIIEGSEEFGCFFRKLIGLALLPADYVKKAFFI